MIEAEKANETTLTISRMCRLLGVDRRRFYEWRARVAAGPSARQQRADELTAQIIAFHTASDGTYGAPRIRADLQDAGVAVSRKTVAKLMRDQGIAGISPRTWHPVTTVHGDDPFPCEARQPRDLRQVRHRGRIREQDLAWETGRTSGAQWALQPQAMDEPAQAQCLPFPSLCVARQGWVAQVDKSRRFKD